MLIIFVLLFLQTLNSNIVKYKVFNIESYYIFVIALLLYYLYILILKRKQIKIINTNRYAFIFILLSLLIFLLSLCNIHPFINNTEIIINKSYILRQSYYLLFFPLFFIFPQNKHYSNIKLFISKNNIIIVALLLIYAIINGYNNYLCFVICFIILFNGDKIIEKVLESILFMVSLLLKYTLTTEILISVLFIIIFIINEFKTITKASYKILHYSFIICILCCFIVPLLDIDFSSILDINSNWRLLYWKDELTQLIKTYGFGVGYGTSYATLEFVERTAYVPLGAFSANENYSVMQQIFVTGSHNSFISVAFRTGLVGALLFVLFIVNLSKEIMKNYSKLSASIIFAFYASIIIITTNVGLESPMYLTIFVFGVGMLLKEMNEKLE